MDPDMDGDGAQSDDDDFPNVPPPPGLPPPGQPPIMHHQLQQFQQFQQFMGQGQFEIDQLGNHQPPVTLMGFKRRRQDDDANKQSSRTLKEMATDKVKAMLYHMLKSNSELLAKVV